MKSNLLVILLFSLLLLGCSKRQSIISSLTYNFSVTFKTEKIDTDTYKHIGSTGYSYSDLKYIVLEKMKNKIDSKIGFIGEKIESSFV